ncbi:oligosaccharide flippase family protein [Terrilactibacillus sp. S3-3]|nr:oligosaccharide flippase family protein [Terrilactibacillus sp. S3-3]
MSDDWIFIALALSIIPINLVTFYKLIFQAVGEFTIYSRIMYASSWATLLVQLVLLFLFKSRASLPYVAGLVCINYIVYIALEWKMPLKEIRLGFDLKRVKALFAVGIFVALGNFAFLTFYSIDRWFVKAFYSTASFAYYSFAISLMQTINILTTSLTTTFYPYLLD